MTDIQRESERNELSPFQDEVDLENFFAGESRTEILSQMQEALSGDAGVMVLTGQSGSGKTTLCQMFMQQVPTRYSTVFFRHTVDSYEEVVIFLAEELGVSSVGEIDGGNVDWALDQITVFLLTESIDLLVIFDEAENIFLATLERIRKLLDRINAAGVRAHLLFSGTDTFIENYEQLSFCDFQISKELHFEITPLSMAETAEYLRGCVSKLTEKDETAVFSDEAVKSIYSLAKGNFRETNIQAEESIKVHGDDTSFMVLLGNVEEVDDTYNGTNSVLEKLSDLFKRNESYLPWIGGGLCCVLILLMLFNLGDDDKSVEKNLEKKEMAVNVPGEQKEPGEVDFIVKEPPQDPEMQGRSLVEEKLDDTADGAVAVLSTPDEIGGQVEEEALLEKDEEIVQTAKNDLQELGQPVEKVVSSQSPTSGVVQESDPPSSLSSKKLLTQTQKKIVKKTVTKSLTSADLLFNQRVAAGASWRNNKKAGRYTVQLMVLTSETAESNLKKMFAEDSYRQEAGNFYIFRKTGMPEKMFVFYGEYQSLERARLVKNSLPQFLRKHQPYAISIQEAMGKVK